MADKLDIIFAEQADLQKSMPTGEITAMTNEQRLEFVRWNVLALEDELHEALAETSWKPWATAQFFNHEEFKNELVDALHFFVNLCLTGGITSDELFDGYRQKRRRNEQRQKEGYTGLDKCPGCNRDMKELPHGHMVIDGECQVVTVS